jgi:hypothetical protein
MPRLHTPGEYPPDWPEINAAVCASVGHRCIRCGHPYTKGTHGKGEWTRCDEHCTHNDGPVRFWLGFPEAQWRILTVHHFDGNKSNCAWWNLLALCQRCHLRIQGHVNPQQPYMLEHSDWIKPYVAGFYAAKYEGKQLTREEVMQRLDELLAHERIT